MFDLSCDTTHKLTGEQELEQEAQREVEVEVEVEAIRERQLPPRYHPETYHGLNAEIKAFIQSGQLSTSRGVCEHAFAALRRSAIGRKYCIRDSATMSCFYASYEFSRTVAFPQDRPNDSMLVSLISTSIVSFRY
jgi:hypothetical protein